jgi:hypothetical protein
MKDSSPKASHKQTSAGSKQENQDDNLSPFEMNVSILTVFIFVASQIVGSLTQMKIILLLPVPFAALLVAVLLYHLLFPLNLSIKRVAFFGIGLVIIWLSIHPAFY